MDQPSDERSTRQESLTCSQATKISDSTKINGKGSAKSRKPYTITKARERWTDEEHGRFLEGMKVYGRSWGRVASHVGTKSAVQIRSHAQKHFNRMKKVQGVDAVDTQLVQGSQEALPASVAQQAQVLQSLHEWRSAAAANTPQSTQDGAPAMDESLKRAAEIVAAAATEAAAAAAAAVVSAAGKKIKEQIDALQRHGMLPGSALEAKGLDTKMVAQAPGSSAQGTSATPSPLNCSAGTQNAAAMTSDAMSLSPVPNGHSFPPQLGQDTAETIRSGAAPSMLPHGPQSFEANVVLQAMQRISALFAPGVMPGAPCPQVSPAGTDNAQLRLALMGGNAGAVATQWGVGNLPNWQPNPMSTSTSHQKDPRTAGGHGPSAAGVEGTFCGDSDVVEDLKDGDNSGGGTGTSQAFSEVGYDADDGDQAGGEQLENGKRSASRDDSGSSHAQEDASPCKQTRHPCTIEGGVRSKGHGASVAWQAHQQQPNPAQSTFGFVPCNNGDPAAANGYTTGTTGTTATATFESISHLQASNVQNCKSCGDNNRGSVRSGSNGGCNRRSAGAQSQLHVPNSCGEVSGGEHREEWRPLTGASNSGAAAATVVHPRPTTAPSHPPSKTARTDSGCVHAAVAAHHPLAAAPVQHAGHAAWQAALAQQHCHPMLGTLSGQQLSTVHSGLPAAPATDGNASYLNDALLRQLQAGQQVASPLALHPALLGNGNMPWWPAPGLDTRGLVGSMLDQSLAQRLQHLQHNPSAAFQQHQTQGAARGGGEVPGPANGPTKNNGSV